MPSRESQPAVLCRLLDMKKITTTNAVITAFTLIIYNSLCDGMTVNWQHNTDILRGEKHAIPKIVKIRGEKHAIPKIVKIPIIDTIEKITVTLD